ncbi:MAG: hypothetical protein ABIE23_02130 [archaeon]
MTRKRRAWDIVFDKEAKSEILIKGRRKEREEQLKHHHKEAIERLKEEDRSA